MTGGNDRSGIWEGGSALMKRTVFLAGMLAVIAVSAVSFGYEVFFSDSAGQKVGMVWEGSYLYVAVKDPDKGACGIDQFQADVLIFDFKTGAYINVEGAWFRELGALAPASTSGSWPPARSPRSRCPWGGVRTTRRSPARCTSCSLRE